MKSLKDVWFRFCCHFMLFTFLISGLHFMACQNHSSDFILGEKFTESNTSIQLIDTLSVQLSTVLLDTIETAGTGNIFVGHFQDDVFGGITCHSYFQVGLPSGFDFQVEDQYDSLTLVILYNGYSFGDTTKLQRFEIHQLTEPITLNDNNTLTSDVSFEYNPNPIGELTYAPRPMTLKDTLSIRLSDDLGSNLFNRLMNDPEMQGNEDLFLSYFPGLALVTDEAFEGSVIGFYANIGTDARMILHTSRMELTVEKVDYVFGLNDIDKQFNQILHDFSSTSLNPLHEQKNELSSVETDNLAYIQGGSGLVVRVDFPSLSEIMLFERGEIAEAILSISPVHNSTIEFTLPSDLILFKTDNTNQLLESVKTSDGVISSSTLVVDEFYYENTAYTFDVTQYLKDELADSYIDPEDGLLVTLPTNTHNTRFYRAMMDSKGPNTELKIYYLKY